MRSTPNPSRGTSLSILREEQMGRDYIPLPWWLGVADQGQWLHAAPARQKAATLPPLPDFVIEFIGRMALGGQYGFPDQAQGSRAGNGPLSTIGRKTPRLTHGWDSDRLTQTSPCAEGLASVWAWEGWQAGSIPSPKGCAEFAPRMALRLPVATCSLWRGGLAQQMRQREKLRAAR